MTRLIDCHSHTALSGHGQGTVADMVARAAELGLHTYCMTEHVGLPEAMDPNHEDSIPDVDSYIDQVISARKALAEQGSDLHVVLGAELDWLGEDAQDGLLDLAPRFELLLGSVHFLEGLPIDNSDNMTLWERYGVDGVWERYFNEWLRMAKSPVPFDVFTHLDLPKVFGERPSFDPREAYAAMADALVARGAAFEINTAGWRKKAAEQYPAEPLLEMLAARGVPVTVGCDAHKPADLAKGVTEAYELLRRLGVKSVAVPLPAGGFETLAL